MNTCTTIHSIQTQVHTWKKQDLSIALVPTMGYFHAGHLGLMRHARTLADKVVVSLFVNPTQFGPGEDLAAYPRDPERDSDLAAAQGVDALFLPAVDEMYIPNHATFVSVPTLSTPLCGASRPTHFQGVCTVVLKLFNIIQPNMALFGEKDWQQLAVLRRMAADLNVPVRLVGCPIARETTGLALSSRNVYLSATERVQAPALYKGLLRVRDLVHAGECDVPTLLNQLRAFLAAEAPLGSIDYVSIFHPDTLQTLDRIAGPAHLALAVKFGRARLIDNISLHQ